MREFHESTSSLGDGGRLREALREDGYLFFRGLLPPDALGVIRDDFVRVLFDSQWLDQDATPAMLKPGANVVGEAAKPSYFGMYTGLQATQSFAELAMRPELLHLAKTIFGEPVFCQPRHMARIGLPDGGALRTRPHQDFRFIQGTLDVISVWIPLAPCPAEVGGLSALSGSPRLGLLDVAPAPGPGGLSVDVPDDDGWHSTNYEVGDALVFRSLTVHASRPNLSGQLRLSVDLRYQPVDDPVTFNALRPHHYPDIPDWPTLSRGWSDTSCLEVPRGLTLVPQARPVDVSMEGLPSRFAAVG